MMNREILRNIDEVIEHGKNLLSKLNFQEIRMRVRLDENAKDERRNKKTNVLNLIENTKLDYEYLNLNSAELTNLKNRNKLDVILNIFVELNDYLKQLGIRDRVLDIICDDSLDILNVELKIKQLISNSSTEMQKIEKYELEIDKFLFLITNSQLIQVFFNDLIILENQHESIRLLNIDKILLKIFETRKLILAYIHCRHVLYISKQIYDSDLVLNNITSYLFYRLYMLLGRYKSIPSMKDYMKFISCSVNTAQRYKEVREYLYKSIDNIHDYKLFLSNLMHIYDILNIPKNFIDEYREVMEKHDGLFSKDLTFALEHASKELVEFLNNEDILLRLKELKVVDNSPFTEEMEKELDDIRETVLNRLEVYSKLSSSGENMIVYNRKLTNTFTLDKASNQIVIDYDNFIFSMFYSKSLALAYHMYFLHNLDNKNDMSLKTKYYFRKEVDIPYFFKEGRYKEGRYKSFIKIVKMLRRIK